MTAAAMVRVEPAAAVELVDLIRQQLHGLIKEHHQGATTQPNLAYQLECALESLLQDLSRSGALDAHAVARVRWFVWVGRRHDMTGAFNQLNPTFGVPAEDGCWDQGPEQRERHTAVHRRELALALGDRAADVLDPPAEPVGVAG